MTRFEKSIVAIIAVSVVSGFIISNQSNEHSQVEQPEIKQPSSSVVEAVPVAPTDAKPANKVTEKPRQIAPNKRKFYRSLLPFIEAENSRISSLRTDLATIQNELLAENELSQEQQNQLLTLSKAYRVSTKKGAVVGLPEVKALLIKVDQIPASLVLSQSANESAWGRSRFAKEANNYFGIWCFKPGCGLVPTGRPKNAKYEVTLYPSVELSVRAYFNNINSHPAYSQLRAIRSEQRKQSQPLTGTALAGGLKHYSARGEAYIEELRAMIRYNQLEGITLQSL